MKKTSIYLMLFLLSSFVSFSVSAQDSETSIRVQPISIGLEVGYSSSFISGDAKERIDEMIQEFNEPQMEELSFKAKKTPVFSPVFGVFVDYQLKENLSFRGGFRFTRRGYNVTVEGEENDKEFQFDQKFSYEEKLRLSTIEIPLSVAFQPMEKFDLSVGAFLGIAMKQSAKMQVFMDQEVFVNGMLSEDLSEGITETTFELSDNVKMPYLGLHAALGYEVYPNLYLNLAFLRTINYIELDYGKLSDVSLNLSIQYRLFDF